MNVGVLLFLPYRAMEARVFAGLAEAGFDYFSPAQARVFQRIAADGSRVTDLAEQAGVTKQTAGFLVDQLERAGYVERDPDPADGRARLVRITERARAVWRRRPGSWRRWRLDGTRPWRPAHGAAPAHPG